MKTNIEIIKALEENEWIWQDCLEAQRLLYNKSFLTEKQKLSVISKIDKHYNGIAHKIQAGKF